LEKYSNNTKQQDKLVVGRRDEAAGGDSLGGGQLSFGGGEGAHLGHPRGVGVVGGQARGVLVQRVGPRPDRSRVGLVQLARLREPANCGHHQVSEERRRTKKNEEERRTKNEEERRRTKKNE
jgi:hypothetical protein